MPRACRGSSSDAGSGIAWSTAMTFSGLVPQVICGAIFATSMRTSRSKAASASVGSVRQSATACSQSAPVGA